MSEPDGRARWESLTHTRGVARILGKGVNRLATPTNYITCLQLIINYKKYYYYRVASKNIQGRN